MLVETVVAVLALGRLQAIYTPIFSGYGAPAIADAPRRLRGVGADHRGRLPPARRVGPAEGRRRRGRRGGAVGSAGSSSCGAPARRSRRRGRTVATPGGTTPVPRRGGRGRRRRRSTPRRRTCSSTPRARPAGPRAPSTSTAASRSRRAQDLAHQFDLGPGDTLFWFTDLGWMMGPWAISGSLMLGARLVLYEGAPDFPGPDRLWALVARHRITHLGPVADRHPRADGPRRGAGPRARPLVAARARLDRRALEPRSLVVVLPRGRRGALPDRQLLGRHGGLGRHRQRQRGRADQARVVLRSVHRDGGRRRRRGRARSVAARSASSSSARRCRA